MSTAAPAKSSATKSSRPDPVPPGMHTVTPHIVCDGAAQAIEFYRRAFNATELCRVPTPDGKLIHAAVKIGDSTVMLVDEMGHCDCFGPKTLKGSPVTLHLSVPNVDASVKQAVEAGAKVVMPVQDMFWGDRYGLLEDPFGHRWSLATHIRDVSPEELQEAAKQMCSGQG